MAALIGCFPGLRAASRVHDCAGDDLRLRCGTRCIFAFARKNSGGDLKSLPRGGSPRRDPDAAGRALPLLGTVSGPSAGVSADEDGIPGRRCKLVQCVKVASLVELARDWMPTSSGWTVPIEAQVSTNDEGKYEFTHLPIGARTFFYSAPGRDLSPTTKDLIVVQDGLGAQLNVTLARPAVLRVQLGWSSVVPTTRFHLVPHRWWPETLTVPVPRVPVPLNFSAGWAVPQGAYCNIRVRPVVSSAGRRAL